MSFQPELRPLGHYSPTLQHWLGEMSTQKSGTSTLGLPEDQDGAPDGGQGLGLRVDELEGGHPPTGHSVSLTSLQVISKAGSRVSQKSESGVGTYHTNKVSTAILPCQALFSIILPDHRA